MTNPLTKLWLPIVVKTMVKWWKMVDTIVDKIVDILLDTIVDNIIRNIVVTIVETIVSQPHPIMFSLSHVHGMFTRPAMIQFII